ncbi:MAG: hypothetical protein GY948_01085 [Alphaproteobacteria bacterium]|nr:hypothetical protein [Alphaproteobacteria bacterium]
MNPAAIGVIWALAFVILESVQYVYFGGLFQKMSSFLFGFLVFGVVVIVVGLWATLAARGQLRAAFANPAPLIGANVSATFAWAAYLGSVQLIEPAIAYTIGAGVMPITAYLAHRLGLPEGEPMRNRTEALGVLALFIGIVYLGFVTVFGLSGFVRGGSLAGLGGVILAVADGVLFTVMLIYCQRMDRTGVGPGLVFGLRFPLYVLTAGAVVALGLDNMPAPSLNETLPIIAIGLALTVPPLYALQRAVASVSTLTIGALTAIGPFVIFALQQIEGRVDYSTATLVGLAIYFVGALFAVYGAVRAATN